MGCLHAQKLAELAQQGLVDFAGVHDTDPGRAREVADRFDVATLKDLEAVISAADAACVAVPTIEHESVAKTLLRGGMDVLVEKPIAPTREAARTLIETAREGRRILQVGHVERFSNALRGILPLLRRPRFIEAHRIGPYPARGTDVSVVLDLMIHDLDIVNQLAGSEVQNIEAVGVPVLSCTEDIANARIRFANGCILNITASRVSLEKMRKIRVFQADAYISIDFASNKIKVVRREEATDEAGAPKIIAEDLEFDVADALLAQDRAFVETVRERGTPKISGDEGYRALDLALRIQESIPPMEELR
jgi:predicted dehydrogenase